MAKTKKSVAKKAPKKTVAKKPAAKSKAKSKVVAKKAAPKKASKATPKKSASVRKVLSAKATKSAPKLQSMAPKSFAKDTVSKTTSIKDFQKFVTPLDDRLIVEIIIGDRKTAGGLYIPDTAMVAGQLRGKVLSAGRGHRDVKGRIRPMDVQAGDVVLFGEYTGTKITLMSQDYHILRESDVLGIVEKN